MNCPEGRNNKRFDMAMTKTMVSTEEKRLRNWDRKYPGLIDAYLDTNNKVYDIVAYYGITYTTLYNILQGFGVRPQRRSVTMPTGQVS